MLDIPGVREAGWDTTSLGITTVRELSHEIGQMQRELMEIWRKIDTRDVNRVFSDPVTDEIAPDYSSVIDNPMGKTEKKSNTCKHTELTVKCGW